MSIYVNHILSFMGLLQHYIILIIPQVDGMNVADIGTMNFMVQ